MMMSHTAANKSNKYTRLITIHNFSPVAIESAGIQYEAPLSGT